VLEYHRPGAMRAYSLDLRTRVLEAAETTAELADRFAVGPGAAALPAAPRVR
jgi:hypothetical protein